MAENLPNLAQDINKQIHEAQQTKKKKRQAPKFLKLKTKFYKLPEETTRHV